MKFMLTEQLKEHMKSKNLASITLLTKIRSCWSGSYAEVSAKFGNKPGGSDIDTYEVDGIKIYMQKGIEAEKEVVKLDLEKFLFMEKISVNGLKCCWEHIMPQRPPERLNIFLKNNGCFNETKAAFIF